MKAKAKKQLKERDFAKEYNDLLDKMGYADINSVEFELSEGKGHIKKFSLYEKTPTPILTDYTFIYHV